MPFFDAPLALAGSASLLLFLVSYAFVVFLLAALLGLGWALEIFNVNTLWPQPQRYARFFSLAFLALLATLGGFPPFFLLGPKLAVFSWLVTLGAWGSIALACIILLLGWYVYWQGASGLFEGTGNTLKPSRKLTRGGSILLFFGALLPVFLSGCLLDLWAFAHWIS